MTDETDETNESADDDETAEAGGGRLIKKLLWRGATLYIKGRNSGIYAITAVYRGKTCDIVDFLNNSLRAEYFNAYNLLLIKYGCRIPSENIFDEKLPDLFPDPSSICVIKNPSAYELYPTDAAVVEVLLDVYNENLEGAKRRIRDYDAELEAWYKFTTGTDEFN
ncbi:MAG: hypothetical protein LBQ44_05065 [Treponema sp.]|jgi:hypothetical protein|nr:hypothetical protein [Treponema sp.]